jgi:hypothetical protein
MHVKGTAAGLTQLGTRLFRGAGSLQNPKQEPLFEMAQRHGIQADWLICGL